MNDGNKINSLYELIKQKSLVKDHPLKIVAGWDEVLFFFSTNTYKFCDDDVKKKPFPEFWKKLESRCSKKFSYKGIGGARKAYEKFTKLLKEREKEWPKICMH